MNKPWLKSYSKGVRSEIDVPTDRTICDLFSEAVEKYPDLPAIECFGATISYKELNDKALAFAGMLQKIANVKRGDRIALMCPNIFAFPIAMLGIAYAGAAQVNVNPLYTEKELAHQLNDAGAEIIVIFSGSTSTLADIIDQTPIKTVVTIDMGDGGPVEVPSPAVDPRLVTNSERFADVLADGAGMTMEPVEIHGSDTMFFQYTGGTTGLSKGAVLSHRNLVANTMQWKEFLPELCEEGKEVFIAALPLYHVFGLMLMICNLSLGSKVVMIPNPRQMDDFVDILKTSKFSLIGGVNTLYQGITAHPEAKNIDFSNYKAAVGGGAAVIRATSEAWKAISGHHIKEGYGLSETSPLLCINPMSHEEFTETCGLPVSSTDVKLLDDDGNEVPDGTAGEICCKGPQVMSGYWNNDDANASAFTKDGYFRTGDIGIFTEQGFLKIVDRKKDMIIVSGFNVYPNEVEAAVTSCPGIAECACIGVPHEKTGEAVRVYAVLVEGSSLTVEEVIAHCREELAGYKVPKQIHFVDGLPKSNVGKILRRELRKLI